jgi:hypothetical protein
MDQSAVRQIGYMRLPAFPVQFHASLFSGEAMFVPASGEWKNCLGHSFVVEIEQEQVTGFRVSETSSLLAPSITALPGTGSFHVSGTVIAITSIAEPHGEQIIRVEAGDAHFTFSKSELQISRLTEGDLVAFTVHEMSLWDTAI